MKKQKKIPWRRIAWMAAKELSKITRGLFHFNGALDIMVVRQKDGSFKSSTWSAHLRGWSAHLSQYFATLQLDEVVKFKINNQVLGFTTTLGRICDADGNGVATYTPKPEDLMETFKDRADGKYKIIIYLENSPEKKIEARIHLLNWNAKIVCVDMDGTLTISTVRGLLCCLAMVDWVHPGAADFLSFLKEKGFVILYLTARPISTIHSTRKYIDSHVEEDGAKLPEGIVITSSHGRIRTAKDFFFLSHSAFKVPCLKQIKELFPDSEPFYAGFGDAKTDIETYTAVGFPHERIFHVKRKVIVTYDQDMKQAEEFSYEDVKIRSMFVTDADVQT